MSLWQQLAAQPEWIGGILMDLDDTTDAFASTKIVGIEFVKGYFCVVGLGFTCGADVRYLGIVPTDSPDHLEFAVPLTGQRFTISRRRC